MQAGTTTLWSGVLLLLVIFPFGVPYSLSLVRRLSTSFTPTISFLPFQGFFPSFQYARSLVALSLSNLKVSRLTVLFLDQMTPLTTPVMLTLTIVDGKWLSYGDDKLDEIWDDLVESMRVAFGKDGIPFDETDMVK